MMQGLYQILSPKVLGTVILGAWLSPAVVAQQSVVENSAATNNCLSEKNSQLEPHGGTGCGRQGLTQWAQAGMAYAHNQMGIESTMTMTESRKRLEKAAAEGYSSAQ